MKNLVARTKIEALHIIGRHHADDLELDYPTAWRDVVELGRLGLKHNIRVTTRGSEYILVTSRAALFAGLFREKSSYRQRNLCIGFPIRLLSVNEFKALQHRAQLHGDMLVTGSLEGMVFHEKW